MLFFILSQNPPFLNEKSRHRETPAAPKLPAFLCACFLVKGLGNFKPTDEADADLFFGEDGHSFNHPIYQGVGILRKVEIFCGDEFHDFLGFVFSAHILLGIQFRTFFHLSQLEHLIADLLDSQIYDFTPFHRKQPVQILVQVMESVFYHKGIDCGVLSTNAMYKCFLQGGSHFFLVALNQGTNGFQDSGIEFIFLEAGGVLASLWPAFQPVDASPDDLLPPVDAPCHPSEITAAVPADKSFRKGVFAGKPATIGLGFLGIGGLFTFPAGDFLLDLVKHFPRNDCRMVVLDVVLREFSIVLLDLAFNEICRVGFLQQDVTHVLLILQDALDGFRAPVLIAGGGWNAHALQSFLYGTQAIAI